MRQIEVTIRSVLFVSLLACGPSPPTVVVVPAPPPPPQPAQTVPPDLPAPAAPSAEPGAEISPGPANLIVTADVRKAGTKDIVEVVPGQALSKGDDVALDVSVDRDAYLYVLYVDAKGEISELFPRDGDATVRPGGQRLPSLGKWWRLDATRGLESFIVLAAAVPLDRSTRLARAEAYRPAPPGTGVTQPAKQAAAKVKTARWKVRPGTSGAMAHEFSRGPIEVSDGIVAAPDTVGVSTAVFGIDHR